MSALAFTNVLLDNEQRLPADSYDDRLAATDGRQLTRWSAQHKLQAPHAAKHFSCISNARIRWLSIPQIGVMMIEGVCQANSQKAHMLKRAFLLLE